MTGRILLAEDRASLRQAGAEVLRRNGFEVLEASDGRTAMEKVAEGGYDLALFDLKMPGHSGLELLKASRSRWPLAPVIVLTGYGSIEVAVEAMKVGATDFLSKPVDWDHLLLLVTRALDAGRQERVREVLESDLARSPAFQSVVGESPALALAMGEALRIAPTDTTCLLLGETGAGKEVFARAIHRGSPRAKEPFVAVNCAAIPGTLLENELFGHEKGAYTGAHEARVGRFEYAHRGTIFLDEIGEMSPDLQAKLLRVLEEKTFTRVGGVRPITVDVRILCATNRDLEEMMAEKAFRQDLYYRLSTYPIRIPPLRERRGDIAPLARHFLAHFRRELGRISLTLSAEAVTYLEGQAWPGNVRELMNRIERAAILSDRNGRIGLEHFQGATIGPPKSVRSLPPAGEKDPEAWLALESKWRAREVVGRCAGDRRRAARVLGLTATKLAEALSEAPDEKVPP